MSLEEFQLAVLGDEPAGLWLLQKYEQAMGKQGLPTRTAWAALAGEPPPCVLPTAFREPFGITTETPWSPEIVTPARNLSWDKRSIGAAFPKLGLSPKPKHAKVRELSSHAIREAVRAHPELLGFCAGVWKFVGRTPHLHLENLVRGALIGTELAYWHPAQAVPESTHRLTLGMDSAIEEVECLSNGAISLKFRNQAPIVSRRWVLNLNVHQLVRMTAASPEFQKLVSVATGMESRNALYAFSLLVEKDGIPCPVRPLTFYFDTDSMADTDTEVWPFQVFPRGGGPERHLEGDKRPPQKELVLWASAPAEASLEAVLDRFRAGMTRLHHLFPFLPSQLVAQSLPLEMESCSSVSSRAAALDRLEASRLEVYRMASFQTATRQPGLSVMLPFLNCHLPYPLGTLQAAQRLLAEIVPKPKRNRNTPRHKSAAARPEASA